jgi:hypothetical protein
MSKPAKMTNGKNVVWKEIEYPTVYSNLIGFVMTPFDISLVLGEVGDSNEFQVTGIPRVKVVLSPEQAANLEKLLNLALQNYTKNNGALRTGGAVDMEDVQKQFADRSAPKA